MNSTNFSDPHICEVASFGATSTLMSSDENSSDDEAASPPRYDKHTGDDQAHNARLRVNALRQDIRASNSSHALKAFINNLF